MRISTLSLSHQPIHLLIRHRAFRESRVRSRGFGFVGHAAQQAHGCAMGAGAVAHALDAQLGEFGYLWDAGTGQNIHGGHPVNIAGMIGA